MVDVAGNSPEDYIIATGKQISVEFVQKVCERLGMHITFYGDGTVNMAF